MRIVVQISHCAASVRRLVREEGIYARTCFGGSPVAAMRIAGQVAKAVIVTIVCNRRDRYLSTAALAA